MSSVKGGKFLMKTNGSNGCRTSPAFRVQTPEADPAFPGTNVIIIE
jgi:hypothetical protein